MQSTFRRRSRRSPKVNKTTEALSRKAAEGLYSYLAESNSDHLPETLDLVTFQPDNPSRFLGPRSLEDCLEHKPGIMRDRSHGHK